jgi:16S rRNA (cytidine1402-2'-O)-methyltransferase
MTATPKPNPKSATVRCQGHPNIAGTHAKTFELTRDPTVTQAGTCIVGVSAEYDEAALLALRGAVRLELTCGSVTDRATARINPKYQAGAPLIFRRMPTPEPRTFCVGADKGSSMLDRALIEALRQPGAELRVTITEMDGTPEDAEAGILTLVGTPIGNLDDLSPRALAVLESADTILCEDTRTTKALLAGFGLAGHLVSYHDHNERDRVATVLEKLRAGARIALVSEAGMPTVSDPGFHVVRAAREAGLTVTAVPGPDAVTTALAISGLPTDDFRFLGFPPRKARARRKRLEAIRYAVYTSVIFESPNRIDDVLIDIQDIDPTRRVALCRNLTKFGEKVLLGTAEEVRARVAGGEAVNGELVLVIAGTNATPSPTDDPAAASDGRLLEALVAAGLPTKALGDALAKATGISRRDGFNQVLAMKKALEE